MAGKSTGTPVAPDETRVLAAVPLTAAGVGTASDAPLFSLTTMAPGERYQRCIVIAADSAGSAVRFAVGGVSGALAPWLRVEGTTGTGTSRDCGDFVPDGTAFYTGSLSALNSAGAEGMPTGWVPAGAERRTFRLAVEVAEDANTAGAQATTTLVWRLQNPQAAPTTAPATSPPVVPTAPSHTAPSHTAPSRTAPSSTTPPVGAPAPSNGGGAAPAAVPPAGAGGAPASCTPTTAAKVGQLVTEMARFSGLALLLLLLVMLFLAVQDRIDRRDPKLAQAPLYGDADVEFPDNGSTPWRTP